MGVLDKYKIRGNRGQVPTKGLFNPGRNQNWDWNELLQTIENNFSTDDSDLEALTTRVTAAEDTIEAHTTDIATNVTNITNATNTATGAKNIAEENTIKIAAICACLIAAEIACEACE